MDKQTNNNKRNYRAWAIAILVPVLLFSGTHFFIAYQVRKLLPTLVSDLSEGTYSLSYEKFRLRYFSPYLTISKVHLRPVATGMDEEHEVKIDALYLSLESLIPIILNDAIKVNEIRLVNPSVLSKRNTSKDSKTNNGSLHLQVNRLQDNAMKFLNALRVDKCTIVNGSFRYYPFPGRPGHFNIEHVDLEVSDLYIPRYSVTKREEISAGIRLQINDPALRIPDTLLKVSLDRFHWDNRARMVDVGKFSISQRNVQPVSDSFMIMLDTIRIRSINWKAWLDSGIVKLDTLVANYGTMYFESAATPARRRARRDTVDLKKLKFWDAIGNLEIDHFSARHIGASIINRNPDVLRDNSLIGDSLVIRSLSVRPKRRDPLRIGEFGLGVREFRDKGAGNQFQSSFSHLKVKDRTMVLNNYTISSTSKSRFGPGARLFIPTLAIEGISIEDILDKKASIREIRMESPELFMFSMPERKNGNRISSGLEELKPYIDVERMVINNARVTVRDRKDTTQTLGTRQFSAVILTRSAMKARDTESLLASFTNVNMKHFFLITPRVQLQLYDGVVDYRNKTLFFGRVEGFLNNKKIHADLNEVSVVASDEVRPFGNDVFWHFRNITVSSGSLKIDQEAIKAELVEDADNKQIGTVDSLSLNNLAVSFDNHKVKGSALINSARVAGHHIYTRNYRWDKALIDAADLDVAGQGFRLNSRQAELNSNGQSALLDAVFHLEKAGANLHVATREVTITGNFPRIDTRDLAIEELNLVRPVIDMEIDPSLAVKPAEPAPDGSLSIARFVLDEPELNLRLQRKDERIDVFTQGELVRGEQLTWERKAGVGSFGLRDLRTELEGITMRDLRKEIFHGGRISASLSSFSRKDGSAPVMNIAGFSMESLDVGRIYNRDTLEINTGVIRIGTVNNLVLQKDSVIQTALKLPPAVVSPGSIKIRTPQKDVSIINVELNTEQEFLEWDSLAIINRVPRDSFFAVQPFEKDYLTFATGRVRADDLRPEFYGRDTAVYIRKLTIEPMDLKVERDKRMPDDTVSYRPLLARMSRKLNFPVKVDTVRLVSSRVWHNVIDEKTEKEGTIYFDDMSGTITNIRNFDIGPGDTIKADLSNRFLGVAPMRFRMREAYTDSLQDFVLNVRMGAMEMKTLNQLITPLLNVRVDKGNIRDLTLKVKGNDRIAYGSMDMHYRNLRVSVLNEQNKRRGLSSWLANIFVRGQNNKTGIIYTERLREKSVFNFWSKIALSGLMTNLGIRKNARQVRRFYRGLDKNDLPPDLF